MHSDDSQSNETLGTAMDEPISISSDKKRKTKKKNENNQTIEATIQVVHDRPDLAPPIIGYFPSGFDPNSGSGGTSGARVFRHASRPKRLQLAVTPADSNVDFVGTNYAGEAEAGQQHFSYGLGVLDKETRTLKIVPIASNKLFRLEPKVRGLHSHKKDPESLEDEEKTKFNKMKLTKAFGTKKALREATKLEEQRKGDNPQAKEDIKEKLKLLDVKPLEDNEFMRVVDGHSVPPHNADATSPQEAYPLSKIILKGDWDFLDDIYQISYEEGEDSWEAYPSFIRNRMKKLQEIEDEGERKRLSGIFSYISHLINFKDRHTRGIKTELLQNPPRILQQKFSNLFRDTGSEFIAADKNTLLISYVLVLTLHADTFRTDLTDISKDLRLSSVTVRGYYEQLGCKLVRDNNLWFATLPVPIQFPGLRQKRRRR